MPGGDRRGPFGSGPMTGRGLGFCGGYDRPGWMNAPGGGFGFGRGGGRGNWGRGRGFGRGFGAGWGRGWGRWGVEWAPEGSFDERRILEERSKSMERELEAIRRRLEELGEGTDSDLG